MPFPGFSSGYDTQSLQAPTPLQTPGLTPQTQQPPQQPPSRTSSLIFVDAGVQDAGELISTRSANTEVVYLSTTEDAIDQITRTLLKYDGISTVHIFSHGDSGRLNFSNGWLAADNISHYTAEIKSWSQALSTDADILLYGCDVAGGVAGAAFIRELGMLTHADIAASTNKTGKGGDWILEAQTGSIEAAIVPDRAHQVAYGYSLDQQVRLLSQSDPTLASSAVGGTMTERNVSQDGKLIVFSSSATNLVAGDTNNRRDIFLYDRRTATPTTTLISSSAIDPTQSANGDSVEASISKDGRYITFLSNAKNLTADVVTGNVNQLYRWDRDATTTTKTTLISKSATAVGDGNVSEAVMSNDGKSIAFVSTSSNLSGKSVGGTAIVDLNGIQDAFLWRETVGPLLISMNSTSNQSEPEGVNSGIEISDNGRFITFNTAASLSSGDPRRNDIYVYDASSGGLEVASYDVINDVAFGASVGPAQVSITSSNKLRVVFSSSFNATNNTNGISDTNGTEDVFIAERDLTIPNSVFVDIKLVSLKPDGKTSGNTGSSNAVISANGRYIAFTSNASDLVTGDTNTKQDVFIRDLDSTTPAIATRLVSRNSTGGALGDGTSSKVRISDDGNIVTFTSAATNLVGGVVANDPNGAGEDVFTYNRTDDTLTLVSQKVGAATTTADLPTNAQNIRTLQTPIVSGDGSTIVYANDATNIVSKDTNDMADIFAFNVATSANTLVTTVVSNQNSITGAGNSTIQPIGSVSKDGRYVVFSSTVNSLVTGDTNAQQDIFLRDTTLLPTDPNSLKLISRSSVSTKSGNGLSSQPFISADGKYVVFSSTASDLISGDDSLKDIFLYDVTSGAITAIVSRTTGPSGKASSDNASVAVDASGEVYVAFTSRSSNLGPSVTGVRNNVYLWKKSTSAIALLSRATTGGGGNQDALTSIISADGKYVAFSSIASNLEGAGTLDTNNVSDIFLYDITANTLKLVSQSALGAIGNAASFNPVISDVGGVVAFESNATNLTAIADANAAIDVFRYAAGVVSLVSANAAGTAAGNAASGQSGQQSGFTGVSLSADGSSIAFTSSASDLSVTTDTNAKSDVFVRNVTTNKTTLISQVAGTASNGTSSNVVISGDGQTVAFISTATNLSTRDADANADVYVSSATTPGPGLISSNITGTGSSNAAAQTVSLNRDGGFVVFDSGASNLIANDANGFSDVFLKPTKSIVTLKATTNTATEGSTTENGVYELTRTDSIGTLQVKLKLDTLVPNGAKPEDFILTADNGVVIPIALGIATVTFADSISKVTLTLKAIADSKAEANETAKFTLDLDSTYSIDPTVNTGTVTIAANETIVTSNANTGEGSLRQAIANANAFAGPDIITFALADPTQKTIALASELAALNTNTTINGGTAGIILDGAIAGANANGLTLTGDGNIVNNITIQNFKGNGIAIAGNNNTIGGTTTTANTITLNNNGVVVQSGTGNRILGNKITSNTLLGIDIAPIGPDAAPAIVIATALPTPTGATLTGTLTKPAGTYRVEFFANTTQDTSLQGEGEIFLGFKDITVDASGTAAVTFDSTAVGLTGKYITATVTDAAGSTSEFAKNKLITPPLPLVELTASVPELIEGNSGVSKYKFNVTLSQAVTTPLTLNYRTLAGTAASGIATAGTDYTAVSTGTVTIAANTNTASFDIDILGDTRYEVDETFQVELFGLDATVVASGTIVATGKIKNDDAKPTISFSQTTVSQAEGQAPPNGKMPFTINLSNASDETITVAYKTIDGTAISTAVGTNPADFIAVPTTTLTFAPGDLTKNTSVEIVADILDEPAETFSVELSAPTNATFAASAATITATGTILPDEKGYVFSVLPLNAPTVLEGALNTTKIVTFTVTLDRIPTEDLTVNYSTVDGTASAGTDYVNKVGTLTFKAGGTLTQTVDVVVNGDDIVNGNRDFTLELNNPTAVRATIDPAKKTSLLTIIDDDLPKLSFNTSDIKRSEGPSGQVTQVGVVVELSAISDKDVTVEFTTLDGIGPNAATVIDNDYVPRTLAGQKITIAKGQLSTTAFFTINGDDKIEADETFLVKLSNPIGAVLSGPDTKSVVILDDDQAIANRPNVNITANSDATQPEGNSGTKSFSFTVTLDKAPTTGKDVTVNVATIDGVGLGGAISIGATPDFTAKNQTLTFIAGGPLSQTFTVLVNGDTQLEPTETFTVQLSGATNSTLTTSNAVGTIIDDDAPASTPRLSITPIKGSDTEGNTGTKTLTYAVTLDKAPTAGQPITVDVVTVDGTGPAGAISTGPSADFVSKTQTLTFLSTGALTQEFSVTINGDTQPEATETFTIELRNASGAVVTTGSAIGTLIDDDTLSTAPPILAISSVSLTEGNSGTKPFVFDVNLTNGPADRAFTVSYEILEGSATLSDNDYQVPPAGRKGNVTFSKGDTKQSITVLVNGDKKLEGNETFTLKLTNPTNSASFTPGGDQAIGSILNDDIADPGNNISLDSLNDLLWRNPTTGETVLWQTNLGPTTRNYTVSNAAYDNSLDWRYYAGADFDQDGNTDYVWYNIKTGQFDIWKMNGTNIDKVTTAVIPQAFNNGILDTTWKIEDVSDYTGDSKPDILWRNVKTGQVVYWEMNEFRPVKAELIQTVADLNWEIEAVDKFTGETQKSIFWRNKQTGQMVLWRMSGTKLNTIVPIDLNLKDLTWKVVATTDLNGDGNSDIVWQNQVTNAATVWYMNRTGLASWKFLPTPTEGFRVKAAGDFNQDGINDLFLSNAFSGQNQIWYFQQSPSGISYAGNAYLPNLTSGLQFVGLGRLNSDKIPSLVWTNASNDLVTWQVTPSPYGKSTSLPILSDINIQVVATVDLDRNGKSEVLLRNTVTGEAELGDFIGSNYNRISKFPTLDQSWVYKGSGDLEGDGDLDLYWQNSITGSINVWKTNGNQYVETALPPAPPENWFIDKIGDFDGDGKADFFWRNTQTDLTSVWLMNGITIKSPEFISPVAKAWKIFAMRDLDRDGKMDFVWHNSETGQNSVWLMDGSKLKTWFFLPTVQDQSWEMKDVADFDRDGNPDILWYNSKLQTASFWSLEGGRYKSFTFTSKTPSPSWDLVGARDFNADGSRDLLWLDKATGTPTIWYMNDMKYGTSASLPNLSSPNFQLIGLDDYAQTPT